MIYFVSTGRLVGAGRWRCVQRWGLSALLAVVGIAAGIAQSTPPTGPQQLTLAGLRTTANHGQATGVQVDAQGNLYLLLNQNDGVRVLKTDGTGSTVLAQALLGAQGDIGTGIAIDPTGNVYVTGTTTSGTVVGTSGAAFPVVADTSANSFVAKYTSGLTQVFVTLCGSGRLATTGIAATADAVFVTGDIFAATLPVTPSGIIQVPAFGSTQNGFVERFSADGKTLGYATYLSGAAGNTAPAAIAADASDDAYIAGYTSSPGYPAIAALVPAMLTTVATNGSSGFLTKLTPGGDGITFSTYIPGLGITSMALDAVEQNLVLSGSVSLGQFPIANVAGPVANTAYQTLLRIPLDGSAVLESTLLAPGSNSYVAPGAGGTVWVDGAMSVPVLPLAALSEIGTAFGVRVNAQGAIDETARFGGLAVENPSNASVSASFAGVAVDGNGKPVFVGNMQPTASSSLLGTETYDLPLFGAPTAALPTTVANTQLAAGSCTGSECAGSATYVARLSATAGVALAWSVDDAPNLTLRNLGSAQATGVQITASGFTVATNCGSTLAAGGECSVALTGAGPGSVTAQAASSVTQTVSIPAIAVGATTNPLAFSPKELDFGIVSSASGAVTRTITVTTIGTQSQTFASAVVGSVKTTTPYTFAETVSDCTISGTNFVLAAGGVCHITIGLTASNTSSNDGVIQAYWSIGTRTVALTAIAQAAQLSVSASEVDFGTQYTNGPRIPRYLYLSNASSVAASHAVVTLPGSSPFTVSDGCPGVLEPNTVCQLGLSYQAPKTPSSDAVTLALDQGLNVLVTGQSLPQPGVNGASANPNLSVSAASLTFATAVVVTEVSSSTQTLTVGNTGNAAFTLGIALTGDFSDTTNCGTSLAAGASCSIVLSFVPSAPGVRDGLVAITAGAGTTPEYVSLSGTGTGILSPANNGTLSFGTSIAGEPVVQWYKVTQSFSKLSFAINGAVVGAPFAAILVEDIGYGHGQPASTAFTASASGTCFNCWLGVQFTPVSMGIETAALSITSSSSGTPYLLALTGTGIPLTGLILTPAAQDFGPVPIHSSSATSLFTLTNLVTSGGAVTVSAPVVTGDFDVSSTPSGGAVCGGTLAYTASCFVEIAFAPTAVGDRTGTLTLQAGGTTATSALTGFGSPDPGLSLNPAALTFTNVPGTTAAQQTVTLTNTSAATLQIALPTVSTQNFSPSTTCGTLTPGETCTISVTFTPGAGPTQDVLQIGVTSTLAGAVTQATHSVPLAGSTTSEDAGLQIIAADAEYGPQATGAMGVTRQFTINNLTAKSLALAIDLPRQFVLAGPPCAGLAPNASCNFSVTFLPLDNGDITGTLFAQGTPADGSATLNGLGYVEGYGTGGGVLTVTGALSPGNLLNFGQVASGQSATKVLTLQNTNKTGAPLTIRRISSGWPFMATSMCGATLAPTQTCTVTLTYTPLNQVAFAGTPPPSNTDVGTLTLESDAASSPVFIDLAGSSTPVYVSAPNDTPPLATFALSQSSLTFATTSAGDASLPQTVTLSNTGTTTLHILGLQTSSDFTAAGNCGTLVPAQSCTLSVTFTPQTSSAATTRISAVEIASDGTTPLEFISAIGTANPASLTIAQTQMTFGTVAVGSSPTLPLQITNTGTTPVTFFGESATGDYTVATGACPAAGGTLPASTSCALQVTFAPAQIGTLTGTLSITTSATTFPSMVALSGVGAQSQLQVSPSTLNFGPIAVGVSANLPLTLVNTGNATVSNIALAVTGDYAVTVPCSVTTLAPNATCSVTVTFTPTAVGTRAGTLTVTSTDPNSPATVALSGSGIAGGTFTLTVAGGATASASVAQGVPANYTLTVTPVNGFSGTVVLNCTPVVAAQYGSCSLLPSSLTLAGAAQNSVATITTVTETASNDIPAARSLRDTALCLMLPGLVFLWKARRSKHAAWRRIGPIAWGVLSAVALMSASGCGGSNAGPNPNLRYTPAGTYSYQVTASSVSTTPLITQTVTVTMVVH
jgi:trimeric autotransporter adhesin